MYVIFLINYVHICNQRKYKISCGVIIIIIFIIFVDVIDFDAIFDFDVIFN